MSGHSCGSRAEELRHTRGRPTDVGTLPRPAQIREIRQETPTVKRFVLDARVKAAPGQFVMVWLPGVEEKPFSVAQEDPLALLVAQVGPFTEALHHLRPRDWVWWRGPFGRGFFLPAARLGSASGGELLLVAGGYGAAPLILLAQQARAVSWPVTVLLGARTASEILMQRDFQSLQCATVSCTEDGSTDHGGLVTAAAGEFVGQAPGRLSCVYGCGPEAMLDALRSICSEHRLSCQLCYEAFIKCGVGVCGSCTRQGLLICREGPVLEWAADGRLLRQPLVGTGR